MPYTIVGRQFITLSVHFVFNTVGVTQRVAPVYLRELRLVIPYRGVVQNSQSVSITQTRNL